MERRVDVGPQVTDIGVEDIAACCPRLKSISLAWCSKMTDAAMLALANNCPDLEILDLSFCHRCACFETLDVSACGRLRL